MSNRLRLQSRCLMIALGALLAHAGVLQAQGVDPVVRHAADARVAVVTHLRRASYPLFDQPEATTVTTAAFVGANVRYAVMVRLDAAVTGVVEVRDESGAFQRLLRNQPVRIASGDPGAHEVVITWRGSAVSGARISYHVVPAQGPDEPVHIAR